MLDLIVSAICLMMICFVMFIFLVFGIAALLIWRKMGPDIKRIMWDDNPNVTNH